MADYTTLSDVLHDLLLDRDSDVAAVMDRHLSPDYQHSVNGFWSTRAEFKALVRRLRQTITGGTIRVHEELRHATTYAEWHTLELATQDSEQQVEAFAVGEYTPDGRFLVALTAVGAGASARPPR
jgi:hypothetical protein